MNPSCRLDFRDEESYYYAVKNNSEKNSREPAFWDRREELAALNAWHAGTPRLAVIHGRRRLGKTTLLRHWLGGTQGFYVQATEGTPASQRAALADDLQALLPGFGDVVYPSWQALLKTMQRQWPQHAPVQVLDEFPYLVQSAPELPSLVQAMVDSPNAGRIPLVISGSSQRMMQGLVLNADAPLYGRAQAVLRLQPLPIGEIRVALDLPDAVSAMGYYAAFGGVPRYWDLVREGQFDSVEQALEHLVFSPRGVLHDEADRVLRDEEAASLERAACELIGRGARRPSELAARLGVKDTTLAKPLRHLVDLGLIDRQAPYDFSKGRPAVGGRRVLYKPADPFLAMWHACVRPYLSGLNVGAKSGQRQAMQVWVHHLASVWEDVCRGQWHRLNHAGIEWEPAGRYWGGRDPSDGEWDVVSVSADRRHVFLGECKWMQSVTANKVAAVTKAMQLRKNPPLPPNVTLHYGLFLPRCEKPLPEPDGVALLDAGRVIGEGIT